MSSNFSGGTGGGNNGGFFSNTTTTNNNNLRSITQNMNNNNNTTNLNQPQQFPFRSPLSGLFPESSQQIGRPDLVGKRSFIDFQQQQQQKQQQSQTGLGFYNRNVKPRTNYQQQYTSPVSTLCPVDFSPIPSLSSDLSSGSVNNTSRYGSSIPLLNPAHSMSFLKQNLAKLVNRNKNIPLPNFTQRNNINNNNSVTTQISGLDYSGQVLSGQGQGQENKKIVDQRLLELEKELLGDDEDFPTENVPVSVMSDSEWSETIQNLLNNPISPSTSSSSCSSTSASPPTCPKQSMIDAAIAISDSKSEVASEILTRLQLVANANGTPEQRLVSHMVSALKPRVNLNERFSGVEIVGQEHLASTQMLYDVSPCFKLGFMAANLTILEAVNEKGLRKIHVVDFDIGKGGQYVHLLHALAAGNNGNDAMSLKITAVGVNDETMTHVGEGLRVLAQRLGVGFGFEAKSFNNTSELTREKLEVQSDDALVVNFAFKLYRLPDESVTTENLRDQLLRRVKGLAPIVMTVVEQEMNSNTAPLVTRVKDACEHYGAFFESLDATVAKDSTERGVIEGVLGRKLVNSVACEGRDRVERCEVFGKWRARMSMAGFQPRVMSQLAAESLRAKLNSGTRGNPGFTVSVEFGGICFGWKARTLTVASAWC